MSQFKFKEIAKRLIADYNEASGIYEGHGPVNPYYWLTPSEVQAGRDKPSYKSYFKMPTPKRTPVVLLTPRSSKRTRTMSTRRRYKSTPRRRKSRNWKAKARREVGNPVGMSNAKRVVTVNINDNLGVSSRTIHQIPLIKCAKGTAINQRLRDLVNLRGFRFELNVNNIKPNAYVLNWAFVHPKANMVSTNTTTGMFDTSEFFRHYGATRAGGLATAMSGLEVTNAAINTDMYAVLRRGRIFLNPGRDSDNPGATDIIYLGEKGANYRFKKLWVPIKRQVVWDPNISNDLPTENVSFVYWLDQPFSEVGQLPIQDVCALEARCIMYFRETRDY